MAPKSSAEQYPYGRDDVIKTSEQWMASRRIDDNLGSGLWRVHDKLYDPISFVEKVLKLKFWGTGCGSVDRTVTSNSRGRWFESSHRQNLY